MMMMTYSSERSSGDRSSAREALSIRRSRAQAKRDSTCAGSPESLQSVEHVSVDCWAASEAPLWFRSEWTQVKTQLEAMDLKLETMDMKLDRLRFNSVSKEPVWDFEPAAFVRLESIGPPTKPPLVDRCPYVSSDSCNGEADVGERGSIGMVASVDEADVDELVAAPPSAPRGPSVRAPSSDPPVPRTGSKENVATVVAQRIRAISPARTMLFKKQGTMDVDVGHALDILRQRQGRGATCENIWRFLDEPMSSRWASHYGGTITLFTIISVLLTMLVLQMRRTSAGAFLGTMVPLVEMTFDAVYTVELIVRFIVCPNRLKFFAGFFNIIDFVSAVPTLVILGALGCRIPDAAANKQEDSVVLALLCALIVMRMLKLMRRFEKFHLLLDAFAIAFEALPVILYIMSVLVVFFSSLVYIIEPLSNMPTIASAVWFTVVTSFTVGYGDVVPVSSFGKVVTTGLIMCSSLYMALPLGIVGNAFSQVWADRDRLLLIKRTRHRLDQSGYSAADIPDLFHLFDDDKDGMLSYIEFKHMIEDMHVVLDGDRVLRLFTTLDKNNTGSVDDESFVQALFPKEYARLY